MDTAPTSTAPSTTSPSMTSVTTTDTSLSTIFNTTAETSPITIPSSTAGNVGASSSADIPTTSTTSWTSSTAEPKDHDNTALIAGLTVGLTCLLILIVLLFCCWKKKRFPLTSSFSVMYKRYFGFSLSRANEEQGTYRKSSTSVTFAAGTPDGDAEANVVFSNQTSNKSSSVSQHDNSERGIYTTNYIELTTTIGKPDDGDAGANGLNRSLQDCSIVLHNTEDGDTISCRYDDVEMKPINSNMKLTKNNINDLTDTSGISKTETTLNDFDSSSKSYLTIDQDTGEIYSGGNQPYVQLNDYIQTTKTLCENTRTPPALFSSQESYESVVSNGSLSDRSMSLRSNSGDYYSEVNYPGCENGQQDFSQNNNAGLSHENRSELTEIMAASELDTKNDSLSHDVRNRDSSIEPGLYINSPISHLKNVDFAGRSVCDDQESQSDPASSEIKNVDNGPNDTVDAKDNRASSSSLYDNNIICIKDKNLPISLNKKYLEDVYATVSKNKPLSDGESRTLKNLPNENISLIDDDNEAFLSDIYNNNLLFTPNENRPDPLDFTQTKSGDTYSTIVMPRPHNYIISSGPTPTRVENKGDSNGGDKNNRESSSDLYDNIDILNVSVPAVPNSFDDAVTNLEDNHSENQKKAVSYNRDISKVSCVSDTHSHNQLYVNIEDTVPCRKVTEA